MSQVDDYNLNRYQRRKFLRSVFNLIDFVQLKAKINKIEALDMYTEQSSLNESVSVNYKRNRISIFEKYRIRKTKEMLQFLYVTQYYSISLVFYMQYFSRIETQGIYGQFRNVYNL